MDATGHASRCGESGRGLRAGPLGRVFPSPNPSAHPAGGTWEKERVTHCVCTRC